MGPSDCEGEMGGEMSERPRTKLSQSTPLGEDREDECTQTAGLECQFGKPVVQLALYLCVSDN